MNGNSPSLEKLEKELRVLQRRLDRSEWHRADLESQHDRDQHLYRRLQADLEAAQARMIQSEKMASLGALTAGIAHEIKNPLNFINNFASLLKELLDELEETEDPEERRALLADLKTNASVIEAHGKRVDDIVRSMMQHASGTSQERRAVRINALVEENVALAWHGKRAHRPDFHAALELDVDEDAGEAMMVGQDIGRVLVNLVNNAFDAVAERAALGETGFEPLIRVTTTREAGHVVLRVSDNGSGMSAEVEKRIFEPFFTTKPTGQGTGLGLSLSYDIVTQGHGGTLTVESVQGAGSTFEVRLPA